MRHLVFLSFLLVLVNSTGGWADDGSGIHFGANGDIVGQFGLLNDPGGATQQLQVREAEIMVYAPVDHLFDGRVSLAAHQESGEAVFELHEAYIGSTKLIPRSRFRIGQFFLGVGRLNQFHRHDWAFISAPKVHRLFFAEEAAIDSGLEYSWLTPLPFYLDVTVGVTNGWVFGHAHTAGSLPLVPTHYLRLETFSAFESSGGVQVGFNYLGRKTQGHVGTSLFGLDSTVKWKNGDGHSYLIQSELWYRTQTPDAGDATKNLGFYIFPNMPLADNFWAGVRFDYYTTLGQKDVLGDPVSSYEYSIVPTLTYKTSEFATLRLAFNLMENRLNGLAADRNRMVEMQGVFILGAHPAHDF